jgi:hypothetical protein
VVRQGSEIKMDDDDEDYTFSSASLKNRRKAQKLRIKKVGGSEQEDDSGAAALLSSLDETATDGVAPTRITPIGGYAPSSTRIKRYGGGAATATTSSPDSNTSDEVPGAAASESSGESSSETNPSDNHQSSSSEYTSSGEGDLDEEYEYVIEGGTNQESGSFPVEVQKDSSERGPESSSGSSSGEYEEELVEVEVEDSENPYGEGVVEVEVEELEESSSETDEGNAEEYVYDLEEVDDETMAKESTARYEKYRSFLGRGIESQKSWKGPAIKLGAAPDLSFDEDDSNDDDEEEEVKTGDGQGQPSMFGGASKFGDAPNNYAQSLIVDSNQKPQYTQYVAHDSPLPDSKILSTADMSVLRAMLSMGSGESVGSGGDDASGLFSYKTQSTHTLDKGQPLEVPPRIEEKEPFMNMNDVGASSDEDEVIDVRTESTLGLGPQSAHDLSSKGESVEEHSLEEEYEETGTEAKRLNESEEWSFKQAAHPEKSERPSQTLNPLSSFVQESSFRQSPTFDPNATGSDESEDSAWHPGPSPPPKHVTQQQQENQKRSTTSSATAPSSAVFQSELAPKNEELPSKLQARPQKNEPPSTSLKPAPESVRKYAQQEKKEEVEEDLRDFLDNEIGNAREDPSMGEEDDDDFSGLWAQSVAGGSSRQKYLRQVRSGLLLSAVSRT